jgi:endonuclease-8
VAEGDTILRLARRFDATLVGEVVADAVAPNPRGRGSGLERLQGQQLEAADAHGKNLLLRFGDLVLHSHLGMNGSWHLYRRGEQWRKPRSAAWAVLGGGVWEAAQFGGPTLRLLRADRLRRDPQLARLGPDILAPSFDLEAGVRGLRADPGRQLGDALLDQGLVAGIGNIFKSEACFAARVDPWRPVGELADEELESVLLAARALMEQAVASGRHPHAVYRARRPCPGCGGRVAVRGQGDDNRSTYWCPSCQAPQ